MACVREGAVFEHRAVVAAKWDAYVRSFSEELKAAWKDAVQTQQRLEDEACLAWATAVRSYDSERRVQMCRELTYSVAMLKADIRWCITETREKWQDLLFSEDREEETRELYAKWKTADKEQSEAEFQARWADKKMHVVRTEIERPYRLQEPVDVLFIDNRILIAEEVDHLVPVVTGVITAYTSETYPGPFDLANELCMVASKVLPSLAQPVTQFSRRSA